MDSAALARHPGPHDHFVQLYQGLDALVDTVAEYVDTGLRRGEAAVIIATPEHREAFLARLDAAEQGAEQGRLRVLDAEQTLAAFMANGMPQWNAFRQVVGGLIAELRLRYPTVRAYGEMVDVLWRRGERDAAIRLEEYWNELGKLQTFSLLCAYRMDPLDGGSYGGALESVCEAHTHLMPARDCAQFDDAVMDAVRKVLAQPFADALLKVSAKHGAATQMPAGQATLLWLWQNMPRAAEKILSETRARLSPAG